MDRRPHARRTQDKAGDLWEGPGLGSPMCHMGTGQSLREGWDVPCCHPHETQATGAPHPDIPTGCKKGGRPGLGPHSEWEGSPSAAPATWPGGHSCKSQLPGSPQASRQASQGGGDDLAVCSGRLELLFPQVCRAPHKPGSPAPGWVTKAGVGKGVLPRSPRPRDPRSSLRQD